MSEVFSYVKPPLEELRDLLPGKDGFDFGTSPHGLSAGLAVSHQETPEALSLSLHAKPLLTFQQAPQGRAGGLPSTSPARPQGVYGRAVGFKRKKPEAYTSPEVRSACRAFTFTEEQREDLAHAALCQAESLMEGREAHMLEVQEAISNLWEIYRILDGGSHAGGQP